MNKYSARRVTLYHGTGFDAFRRIRKEGLKTTDGRHWMYGKGTARKVRDGSVYLTPKLGLAAAYASGREQSRPAIVLEISVPVDKKLVMDTWDDPEKDLWLPGEQWLPHDPKMFDLMMDREEAGVSRAKKKGKLGRTAERDSWEEIKQVLSRLHTAGVLPYDLSERVVGRDRRRYPFPEDLRGKDLFTFLLRDTPRGERKSLRVLLSKHLGGKTFGIFRVGVRGRFGLSPSYFEEIYQLKYKSPVSPVMVKRVFARVYDYKEPLEYYDKIVDIRPTMTLSSSQDLYYFEATLLNELLEGGASELTSEFLSEQLGYLTDSGYRLWNPEAYMWVFG